MKDPLPIYALLFTTVVFGFVAGFVMLLINERRCGLSRHVQLYLTLGLLSLSFAVSFAATVPPRPGFDLRENRVTELREQWDQREAALRVHGMIWRLGGFLVVAAFTIPQRRKVEIAEARGASLGPIWNPLLLAAIPATAFQLLIVRLF